jgi:hypothetical protein
LKQENGTTFYSLAFFLPMSGLYIRRITILAGMGITEDADQTRAKTGLYAIDLWWMPP